MLQELWSELVMNVDKSRQSNMFSLFGETSKDSYEEYWEKVAELLEGLKSSSLIGGLLSPEKWFSWRAAVVITLFCATGVGGYKLVVWLFPGLMPRLKTKVKSKNRLTKVEFYNRVSKVLKKMDMTRQPWETPREFLTLASQRLSDKGVNLDPSFLASCFYELRFGSESLSQDDEVKLSQIIGSLEALKI
jgi:hypothetical protein